jgi:hypothetical protein
MLSIEFLQLSRRKLLFLGGEIWAVCPYFCLSVPAEVHLHCDALTDKKGRHGTVRRKTDSSPGACRIEI